MHKQWWLMWSVLLRVLCSEVIPSTASASEELSVRYACVACHELDFKKVGPAFQDIAKKYQGADERKRLPSTTLTA